MKQILILSSVVLLLANCTDSNKNYKPFPKSMTTELDKIVSFFDAQVCEEVNGNPNNLEVAYDDFFELMYHQLDSSWIRPVMSEEELDVFIMNLDTTIFNEIWRYGNERQYLLPNLEGTYFKFLKREGRKNINIKRYYESIENLMIFGTPTAQEIILNHKEMTFDVTNPRHRLILAIDFISSRYEYHNHPKVSHFSGYKGFWAIDCDLDNFNDLEKVKTWLNRKVDVFSGEFMIVETIENIEYHTTINIKEFGASGLYKVQLSNELPTQMEKEYYIAWNESSKKILVLPFSKIVLFPLQDGNSEYLIGGFSAIKKSGFLYLYQFDKSTLLQRFASENFCKKPLWNYNDDEDCV